MSLTVLLIVLLVLLAAGGPFYDGWGVNGVIPMVIWLLILIWLFTRLL